MLREHSPTAENRCVRVVFVTRLAHIWNSIFIMHARFLVDAGISRASRRWKATWLLSNDVRIPIPFSVI